MSDILEKNAGFKWLRNLNKRDGTARNFVLLRKVIRLSNRLVAAEKERDEWKAKAETLGRVIARIWETAPLTSYHLAPFNAEHSKALRALTELVNAACSAEKEKE